MLPTTFLPLSVLVLAMTTLAVPVMPEGQKSSKLGERASAVTLRGRRITKPRPSAQRVAAIFQKHRAEVAGPTEAEILKSLVEEKGRSVEFDRYMWSNGGLFPLEGRRVRYSVVITVTLEWDH